jgi:hypothetical protein
MHFIIGAETVPIRQFEVHDHDIDAAPVQELEAFPEPVDMVHFVRNLPRIGQITPDKEGIVGIIFYEQDGDRPGIHECPPTVRAAMF